MKLPFPVLLLSFASLFNDIASEAIYPLLPLYLTSVLGASVVSLGVIEGVAESATAILKLFSGFYSDRLGRAKPLVLGGYFLSGLMKAFIGLAQTWPQVLCLRFADRLGKGLRSAPRDAWLARLSPSHRLAHTYAFHRAMDHLGAIIGPTLGTVFLFFLPGQYRLLFLLTIIPTGLALLCIFSAKEASLSPVKIQWQISLAGLPKEVKTFISILFLFTLANASDAFLLLKLHRSGIPEKFIPVLWAAFHGVKMLLSFASVPFSRRFSAKNAIVCAWILYAAVYSAFSFVDSPLWLVVIFLGYGAFYGLTEAPERTYIALLTPKERLGAAFGLYSMASALSLLPASFFFGLLWERFGAGSAFICAALTASLAAVLLATLLPPAPTPVLAK